MSIQFIWVQLCHLVHNAMGNVQQRCIFASPLKQDLRQLLEGARRPAAKLSVVFYSWMLTRGSNLSRSANAVSAENRKFFLSPSHLAPSFRVTPFKFMEKLYGSGNWSFPGSQWLRFGDPSLHHFWPIHSCNRRMDRQTDRIAMAKTRYSSSSCCA